MRLIPVPELIAVLIIALVVLGLRTLWRFTRGRLPRRAGSAMGPGETHVENDRKRARLIASCAGIAIVSIPLILRVVPPNGLYGFRTALTQSSPAIWYPANAFMGWALLVAAVISATLLAILPATVKPWFLWATFLVPVCSAIVSALMYLKRLG